MVYKLVENWIIFPYMLNLKLEFNYSSWIVEMFKFQVFSSRARGSHCVRVLWKPDQGDRTAWGCYGSQTRGSHCVRVLRKPDQGVALREGATEARPGGNAAWGCYGDQTRWVTMREDATKATPGVSHWVRLNSWKLELKVESWIVELKVESWIVELKVESWIVENLNWKLKVE